MDARRSAASAAIFAVAVAALAAFPGAYAQQGISMMAEADGDRLSISGITASDRTDITIKVTAPSFNVVQLGQVSPGADGTFSYDFNTGILSEDGWYTIEVRQGQSDRYHLKTEFEVMGGVVTQVEEAQSTRPGILAGTPEPRRDAGLVMMADGVIGTKTIMITGDTDRANEDIALTITTPTGDVVDIGQITPEADGTFAETIMVGDTWKEDGIYMLVGQQNQNPIYKVTTEVEIKDGLVIPEFGVIAVVVLAAAVLAVVAVTSRSRLAIAPRA
ncbi:MAG: PEFG-CTERM sorting domain-containing protein [Nitrosopumilus sp.]|nr:PEFG-CTERM sorting domain-containing protein [Nitrosopumilus sp.]MDA7943433.1 PEFG-CTERM sorting domain-containing protein [Nitrosopumilus sp.]MDA7999234.1 PEFG-CTERM sorting domain-containing protein [Nitrosopumilus sp.]